MRSRVMAEMRKMVQYVRPDPSPLESMLTSMRLVPVCSLMLVGAAGWTRAIGRLGGVCPMIEVLEHGR